MLKMLEEHSSLMFSVCNERISKASSDLLFQGDLRTSLRPGLQKRVSACLFSVYKQSHNFSEIVGLF